MNITDAERKFIVKVLEEVRDLNRISGVCDDWEIEDTPENRQILLEMNANNVGKSVEDWKKSPDFYEEQSYDGKICTYLYAAYGHVLRLISTR